MPVCEVARWDLERLTRAAVGGSELEDLMPRLKCEVEELTEEKVVYEATHDRPDLFSAEGLSRALRGLLGVERGLRRFRLASPGISAFNEGPGYRPYILFATVHGLRLDEEAVRQIMQLQEKLHATYGRNRRKVSIGVYDLARVKPPVRYVGVEPDAVSFRPLDFEAELTPREILERHPKGMEYGHLVRGHDRYPLLVDAGGNVLSMPPIINSEDTRVTTATRDVLIDVTATSVEAASAVLAIFATSLAERGEAIGTVEIVGGEPARSPNLEPRPMRLDVEAVEKLLGLRLGAAEVADYLSVMRFEANPLDEDTVEVLVPAYRPDILHQVDLAEEVLMAYGYDRVEALYMPSPHPGAPHPLEAFSRGLRELLAGFGLQEVNNYMLTSREVLFGRMGMAEEPVVEVANPRQETFSVVRSWLTPQLLQVLSHSSHADYPQRIFECGDVAIPDEGSELGVREERRVALAICDSRVALTDMHALLDSLMRSLGLRYALEEFRHPSLIEGRAAKITVGGVSIGFMGEVHPLVLESWRLEKPVVVAELSVNALMECYGRAL